MQRPHRDADAAIFSAPAVAQSGALQWEVPAAGDAPIANLWQLVRRHALLVGACAAVAGAAGAVATARLPRLYEASVSVRVDPEAWKLSGIGVPNVSTDNAVGTELEMLRSRDLVATVTDSLGLRLQVTAGRADGGAPMARSRLMTELTVAADAQAATYRIVRADDGQLQLLDSLGASLAPPMAAGASVRVGGVSFRLTPAAATLAPFTVMVESTDDAVDRVQKWTTVSRRSREANLLDVHVKGGDPALVRDVANAFGRLYVANHQSARQLEARRSVAFLGDQLNRVSSELQSAERSLRDYRARAGVVSLADEASTGVGRRAELLAQRNAINAERDALVRLLESVGTAGGVQGGRTHRDLLAFPTLLQSDAASGIQSALTAAEQRRSELLTRRTDRDEDVMAVDARIAQLHGQLRGFVTTYAQGLGNQVRALDATLSRSDAALATLPSKNLRQGELERGAKTTEAVFAMLQARYKEAEIAAAATDASIRLVDAAVLPRKPVSPKPFTNLLLAVLAGTMLGVAGASVRESGDRSLRTRAQLLALTGFPVLSLIPRLRAVRPRSRLPRLGGLRTNTLKAAGLPGGQGPHALVRQREAGGRPTYPVDDLFGFSESYGRLVTNLGSAAHAGPVQVVLVTSALPGDGKTTVATNLALTLARDGRRVLLIDADLRSGRVEGLLGLPLSPGLGEVSSKKATFDEAVRPVAAGDRYELDVLVRGTTKADPVALLGSNATRELLTAARARYDVIVIDTPPVNSVADAAVLTRHCDGVLLVARAGATGSDAVVFAVEQLRLVRAPIIGAVLNDVDLRRDAGVDGAYQYYGKYTTSGSGT